MEKPLALDKDVYLLNGGNEADGPGGLTRINEDGSVTTRLFEDVNGHSHRQTGPLHGCLRR